MNEPFNEAVNRAKQLTQRPSNEDLLALYALFKQATEGDATGDRPTGFDFKAIAKYDAWKLKQSLTSDVAMQQYIALVDKLSN